MQTRIWPRLHAARQKQHAAYQCKRASGQGCTLPGKNSTQLINANAHLAKAARRPAKTARSLSMQTRIWPNKAELRPAKRAHGKLFNPNAHVANSAKACWRAHLAG
jgi:hypothetical protein